MDDCPVVVADTITKLPTTADGAVVVSGSHGGVYPAYLAAKAGVRAVIFNDAGVGKDAAGVEGISELERWGVAAASVSYLSCRIGDTGDMLARGVISHANAQARACGVEHSLSCRAAAQLLQQARHIHYGPLAATEGRAEVDIAGRSRRIILLDSAALVRGDDKGQIVVTGSHGGIVGNVASNALRVDAFAAVFNDAGIGIDNAGVQRLLALELRGIAAFTVSATTARIGDARSTYEDGIVSALNPRAARLGASVGSPARGVLANWAVRRTD